MYSYLFSLSLFQVFLSHSHAQTQSYNMSLPHTGAFSAFLFGSCIPAGGLGAIAEYWHPTFKKFSIFVDPPPFRSPFHYFFGNPLRNTFPKCLHVAIIFIRKSCDKTSGTLWHFGDVVWHCGDTFFLLQWMPLWHHPLLMGVISSFRAHLSDLFKRLLRLLLLLSKVDSCRNIRNRIPGIDPRRVRTDQFLRLDPETLTLWLIFSPGFIWFDVKGLRFFETLCNIMSLKRYTNIWTWCAYYDKAFNILS